MSDWRHRQFLLGLVRNGVARVRTEIADEIASLRGQGWIRTKSRDVVEATGLGLPFLSQRLSMLWPDWEAESEVVERRGLDPLDARSYERARIADGVELFPAKWPRAVNRRTVAGLVTGSAKRSVPDEVLAQLGASGIAVTTDEVVRLRAFCRLEAHAPPLVRDVERETAVLGEFILAERGLQTMRFDGNPQALVTVENKGPFVDFPAIPGVLLVFMPGWDMTLARGLLGSWPTTPVFHFGDLDPAGAAMAKTLASALGRTVGWVVLDAAMPLMDSHAADEPSPWAAVPPHPLLQSLARDGRWLEQEPLVLSRDFPRAIGDLQAQTIPIAP